MTRIKKAPSPKFSAVNSFPVLLPISDPFWDHWCPNPDSFAFELRLPHPDRRVPSKHRPFRTGALCP